MSGPSEKSARELREVRFNLGAMLREVAEERRTGAFSSEKVHQKDIRKLFRPKPRKSRG